MMNILPIPKGAIYAIYIVDIPKSPKYAHYLMPPEKGPKYNTNLLLTQNGLIFAIYENKISGKPMKRYFYYYLYSQQNAKITYFCNCH